MQKRSAVDGPTLYGAAWHRRPGGLWIPSDLVGLPRVQLALDGDERGRGPIAVLNRLPGSIEQFGVFVDEEALGLEVSTLASLEHLVAQIGFEPAVAGLANVAIWIDGLSFHAGSQMQMARQIFSLDWIVDRIARFLAPQERGVVVAEQHLAALHRLLVLHARDIPMAKYDNNETLHVERSVAGNVRVRRSPRAERHRPSRGLDSVLRPERCVQQQRTVLRGPRSTSRFVCNCGDGEFEAGRTTAISMRGRGTKPGSVCDNSSPRALPP